MARARSWNGGLAMADKIDKSQRGSVQLIATITKLAALRNPRRDIPRATMLGTIAAAVVYMLSLTAASGIVPTPEPPRTGRRRRGHDHAR